MRDAELDAYLGFGRRTRSACSRREYSIGGNVEEASPKSAMSSFGSHPTSLGHFLSWIDLGRARRVLGKGRCGAFLRPPDGPPSQIIRRPGCASTTGIQKKRSERGVERGELPPRRPLARRKRGGQFAGQKHSPPFPFPLGTTDTTDSIRFSNGASLLKQNFPSATGRPWNFPSGPPRLLGPIGFRANPHVQPRDPWPPSAGWGAGWAGATYGTA